jgi:signal transduction histidine kinase
MPNTPTYAFGRDARSNRVVLALLGLGFVALIAAGIAAILVQRQIEHDAAMVEHTFDVETSVNRFAKVLERTETARRGALLSPDPIFPAIYRASGDQAAREMEKVRRLTEDNPSQQARAARIAALLAEYRSHAEYSLTTLGADHSAVIAGFNTDRGVRAVRAIRRLTDEVLAEEQGLLAMRSRVQDSNLALFYAVLFGAGVLIVLTAGVTVVLIRRNLREINDSRRELRMLNTQLEGLVDARTAELQRANAEIQRFAYIVSHDLRSPLVNVMGFTAELDAARDTIARHFAAQEDALPESVRLAVDEDLPESIGFIRSSTQKMDRLINAILRLSREGRRNLAPARVPLGDVAAAVVDSLQHRIQETGTEVSIAQLPAIFTDRLAVEQILSNLVENALKYLQPGRPGRIEITAQDAGDRIHLSVADNGRGIEPRDHERIFDLFRRSGQQDQPGEGIGLAHVRALAYRLGGLIDVESTPGEGSTFTVVLPREFKTGVSDA